MFWFKTKTIVIDAFTYRDTIAEQYPISRASRHIPDWWKFLPAATKTSHNATLKNCQGFIDLYANSFVLPLWSDLEIELFNINNQNGWKYQYADQFSILDQHDPSTYNGFVNNEKYQHFKFIAPWIVKESTGVKFTLFQPSWNMGDLNCKYSVLPGVLDFKYQHSVNVNAMFEYPADNAKKLLIEAGTPIAQFTAHSDKSLDIRCHSISEEEFKRKFHITKFTGSYLERKKRINSNESKCPFKAWH